MTIKELKEKRPNKFKVGDIVRVKNQKKYKKIGVVTAVYYVIYPDSIISYRYDVKIDDARYNNSCYINRYYEHDLVKEEK